MHKKRLGLAALMLVGGFSSASAGDLCVTIRKVIPQGGTLMVALYDSAQSYKAEKYMMGQQVAPSTKEVNTCFKDLPSGNYAIAAFQDINGNGVLEKTLFGEPTEPYGFSRDARALFGPPDFDNAAVSLGTGRVDTVLTLKH